MVKQKHRQFKYLTVAAARRKRRERKRLRQAAFQHVRTFGGCVCALAYNFKEMLYIISRLIVLSIGLHRDTSYLARGNFAEHRTSF